tara:strand:+ start:10090 stop:10626 length:537 start_codon:yes stop_codon:yes gene_type:complete
MNLCDHLRNTKLVAVLAHWRELSKTGLPPKREQLDPSRITVALGNVALVDYLPDGDDYRFRLIGEHVQEVFHHGLSKKRLSEIYSPSEARLIKQRWDFCRQNPALLYDRASRDSDSTPFESERIILPLRGESQAVDCLITASVYALNPQVTEARHQLRDHRPRFFDCWSLAPLDDTPV